MPNVEEWVGGLCSSLQRACETFGNPVVQDTEKGHEIFFEVYQKVDPELLRTVRKYVSSYCRSQGYTMTGLILRPGHLRFHIRPAESGVKRRGSRRTSERTPTGR